ncbi:hypothetical protein BGZ63DRAFT_386476 [Mariannaea sp. PMI_226]|nr:hypothetical protein BGZ63DRAFT_386476 [Mariannaea sp. PMI_226]
MFHPRLLILFPVCGRVRRCTLTSCTCLHSFWHHLPRLASSWLTGLNCFLPKLHHHSLLQDKLLLSCLSFSLVSLSISRSHPLFRPSVLHSPAAKPQVHVNQLSTVTISNSCKRPVPSRLIINYCLVPLCWVVFSSLLWTLSQLIAPFTYKIFAFDFH